MLEGSFFLHNKYLFINLVSMLILMFHRFKLVIRNSLGMYFDTHSEYIL